MHIRNLKIYLLFVIPLFTTNLSAQKKVQYLQYEDLKPYHFGFLLGIHTQDLIFQHTGIADAKGNRWYASVPSYTPGFSVGIIGDLRLTDFLSLRSTPTIHFGSKEVDLKSDATGTSVISSSIRSNYIMIPLSIRYRGARSNNYRPYLISGFSVALDMGRDDSQPILLQPLNTYWEIGTGCDIYLPYFRLVPELKFCLGLGDILVHHRKDEDSEIYSMYTNAFNKVTSRLLILSFQFE